jgi:hypothetical protein
MTGSGGYGHRRGHEPLLSLEFWQSRLLGLFQLLLLRLVGQPIEEIRNHAIAHEEFVQALIRLVGVLEGYLNLLGDLEGHISCACHSMALWKATRQDGRLAWRKHSRKPSEAKIIEVTAAAYSAPEL